MKGFIRSNKLRIGNKECSLPEFPKIAISRVKSRFPSEIFSNLTVSPNIQSGAGNISVSRTAPSVITVRAVAKRYFVPPPR